MSLSPITPIASAPAAVEPQRPTPAPAAAQVAQPATLKPDTVSLSTASPKGGETDGDHDGR